MPEVFLHGPQLGAAKPDIPSFQLNKAVDELSKREFDVFRKKKEPHPLMKAYGVDAVPFDHAELDIWRDNFKGIQYHHRETNFFVSGAIDDVWQGADGKMIVLDYKATWTEKEASLEDDWKQGWKRQLEVYQWLFRKNGFEVSSKGYFIYCNVDCTGCEGFNNRLDFKVELWPYEGDDSWVEPMLFKARECLQANYIPLPDSACDYCAYRKASAALAAQYQKEES